MTDDRPAFKVDDPVEWSSGANGSLTTKQGTIIAIVRPGQVPTDVVSWDTIRDKFKRMFDGPHSGPSRDEVSYLVSVPDGNRKPRLYWPRTRGLRKIGEES